MNEAETRAELIDPALHAAGWGVVEGSRVRREVITLGRLQGAGKRTGQDIADYVLFYRGQKLAVIEAKRRGLPDTEGVAQAKIALEKYDAKIGDAIAPLVHKRTEAAEVFTTVHTAWNNLIIDGVAITDEAIVTEAREDWHRDKMDIPRNRFFEAIQDIRQRDLIPQGNGKRVGKKQGGLL